MQQSAKNSVVLGSGNPSRQGCFVETSRGSCVFRLLERNHLFSQGDWQHIDERQQGTCEAEKLSCVAAFAFYYLRAEGDVNQQGNDFGK